MSAPPRAWRRPPAAQVPAEAGQPGCRAEGEAQAPRSPRRPGRGAPGGLGSFAFAFRRAGQTREGQARSLGAPRARPQQAQPPSAPRGRSAGLLGGGGAARLERAPVPGHLARGGRAQGPPPASIRTFLSQAAAAAVPRSPSQSPAPARGPRLCFGTFRSVRHGCLSRWPRALGGMAARSGR